MINYIWRAKSWKRRRSVINELMIKSVTDKLSWWNLWMKLKTIRFTYWWWEAWQAWLSVAFWICSFFANFSSAKWLVSVDDKEKLDAWECKDRNRPNRATNTSAIRIASCLHFFKENQKESKRKRLRLNEECRRKRWIKVKKKLKSRWNTCRRLGEWRRKRSRKGRKSDRFEKRRELAC